MVADRGEVKRTVVLYGGKTADGAPTLYNGELASQKYRVDRADLVRRGWPVASEFMCAGCLTAQARVWDHCHTHGYVRAPLCNRCNTRNWRGWQPAYGRALPTRNLDTTYYQRCPEHGIDPDRHCSSVHAATSSSGAHSRRTMQPIRPIGPRDGTTLERQGCATTRYARFVTITNRNRD